MEGEIYYYSNKTKVILASYNDESLAILRHSKTPFSSPYCDDIKLIGALLVELIEKCPVILPTQVEISYGGENITKKLISLGYINYDRHYDIRQFRKSCCRKSR